MGHISVRLDDELEDLLEEKQDSLPYEVPKSEIVRTALREHLQGNATAAKAITAD
jgi:Arc/MetJ-type ribon-helix-helix transcriptional regulator